MEFKYIPVTIETKKKLLTLKDNKESWNDLLIEMYNIVIEKNSKPKGQVN